MQTDTHPLYLALLARDARFDGLFFVGVTSTGIYCRPVCPVKPPKEVNCRFFNHAPEAEQAGFRPCLRCRPELAPGNAPMDASQRIAHLVVQRIEEGAAGDLDSLETIAREFELSSRQIRRIIRQELGVPPIQLLLTRRLLLAKQLLTETRLPVIEIAFASGFASLRRFNDAFATRYGMPPTRLRLTGMFHRPNAGSGAFEISNLKFEIPNPPRGAVSAVHIRNAGSGDPAYKAGLSSAVGRVPPRGAASAVQAAADVNGLGASTLQLAYRPPYDWAGILAFLKARALAGIEWVTAEFYARTVQLGEAKGWIKILQAQKKNTLLLEFTHSLTPVLPALLNRVRGLFDLNARPEIISRHLARDKVLGPLVRANPGLRVPGAFHGFELGLRAILGQQVTVKAATTIAGRLVASLGEPISTPFPEMNRLSPSPTRIAKSSVDQLARFGIVAARCRSLIGLARAQVSGELSLDSGNHHDPEAAIKRLADLPGIGPWTANYIAMRALRWPDAFPKEDIAVRNRLGGITARQAEAMSQAWRPWRSYAVLHLWNHPKLSPSPRGRGPG